MGDLPGRLKTEIYRHINGDIIAKVPFFKDTNPGSSFTSLIFSGFINMLVEALRPEIFTPGDLIVKEGDVGTEMYFISQVMRSFASIILNVGTSRS